MISTREPFGAGVPQPKINFLSVSINNNNVFFAKQEILYPVQGNLIVDLSLLNENVFVTSPKKVQVLTYQRSQSI